MLDARPLCHLLDRIERWIALPCHRCVVLVTHPATERQVKCRGQLPVLAVEQKSYKSTQAKISELTDQCDTLRKDILHRMGEAEQITLNNKVLATWKSTKPAQRLDTKALAAAHPKLVDQFMLQGAISRRFVVKELA